MNKIVTPKIVVKLVEVTPDMALPTWLSKCLRRTP